MKDCIGGDEIEVFAIANMQDLIEFKWTSFALSHHTLGFYLHLFYIAVLTVYTHMVYINDTENHNLILALDILLVIGIIYPTYLVLN